MGTLELGRHYLLRTSEVIGIPEVRNESVSVAKRFLAEFLGTTLVVLVWTGTVMSTVGAGELEKVTVSLTVGFIVAAMTFVTQQISGGHLNPTITIGHLIACKMSPLKAILYIVAQMVGGIVAAAILQGVSSHTAFGANFNKTATVPSGDLNNGQALGIEILISIVITLTALVVVNDNRHVGFSGSGPILIGLAMASCHFSFMTYTGPGMNPARSFGPAVLTGQWDQHWIYWTGGLLGALIAALLFLFVLKPRQMDLQKALAQISEATSTNEHPNKDIPLNSVPMPVTSQTEVVSCSISTVPESEGIEIPTSIEVTATDVEIHREVEIR